MHTRVNVIYGILYTREANALVNQWDLDEDPRYGEGLESLGFEVLPGRDYRGFPVIYVGVRISSFASLPGSPVLVQHVRMTPTKEQREEAERKIAALFPELRAALAPEGGALVPKLWFLPSES